MKPLFPWLRVIASTFQEPPIDATFLRQEFSGMSDERLRRIEPFKLTALARPLWREEMDRRRLHHKDS